MDLPAGQLEWLETSRFGSFALGCVDRRLRRKYHTLLTAREPGRGDPWSVLAEVRERLIAPLGLGDEACDGAHERSEEALLCDPLGGELARGELVSFSSSPSCVHRYRALGLTIERTLSFGQRDQLELRYRITGVRGPCVLTLEPLLRCRALHALTFENPFLDGSLVAVDARAGARERNDAEGEFVMQPYAGMPQISFRIDGAAARLVLAGRWLTDVFYPWEVARGYEAREHLFSPGHFAIELRADAELTLAVGLVTSLEPVRARFDSLPRPPESTSAHERHSPERAGTDERRDAKRPSLEQALERALSQFAMQSRSSMHTLVAGYPWFEPRGRDTLIALPGLYLAQRDFELVAAMLEDLLSARVHGLVPHVLRDEPDAGPDGGSADVSLWFIRTVQWLGAQAGPERVERFMPAVCELLEALADGHGARARFDHGVGVWSERGPWTLTWMDAVQDGWPVTARAGYAVEVDALAYNAARFACAWGERHRSRFARAFRTRLRGAEAEFARRYWDDTRGYLADAHDGARPDPALRPNQLFALGLPYRPLPVSLGRSALTAVRRELLVPAGLRSLSPHHPAYRSHYEGSSRARELASHQGTVWPWLLGIYADAVCALRGRAALEVQLTSMRAFFAQHLDDEGCIGQVAELFSGAPPHVADGAPAYACSVAELYRALCVAEAELRPERSPRPARAQPSRATTTHETSP